MYWTLLAYSKEPGAVPRGIRLRHSSSLRTGFEEGGFECIRFYNAFETLYISESR
jgi:hypothetical protein